MDSPRGRIDLMRGLAEGKIAWSPAVAAHFDRCLGCMGCVPACPSGVKYDVLIEATRAEREKRVARPLGERIHRGMIFALFPYPRRLKVVAALLGILTATGLRRLARASGLLDLLPDRWSRMEALLPEVSLRNARARFPERVAPRGERRARVAYHDACHLAHAQRVRQPPRALLAGIPGLELVEIPEGDQCCGSAGIYNLVEPESSEEIGARKADNVLAVRPDFLASANPGCTLQIQKILRQRGQTLPAAHPIEILDASIAGRSLTGAGSSG